MSVRVRLTRVGSKKNARWRVVVADQRSPRDGRTIETVGHYNPQTDPSTVVLDRERLDYWIERGAQPSNSVRKLMRVPAGAAPAVVEEATAEAAVEAGESAADVAAATEPDAAASVAEPADDADPPSEGAGDAESA
ncbi:MAG: 30S ribosomal protein S16 [Thermoleophilaceae bacterium]